MTDTIKLRVLYVCPRCLTEKAEHFTWAHRPNPKGPYAGQRTCGGNPVLTLDLREDGPLTTEEAAVTMGRTWLAEHHPDESSGGVLYRDAVTIRHFVAFEATEQQARVTSQHLATSLRNLSGSAALFEQNPTPENRDRLNRHNDAAESLLGRFVEQEGDIIPPPGSDLPG